MVCYHIGEEKETLECWWEAWFGVLYDEHSQVPGIVLGGAISLFPHREQAVVEQSTWNMIYRYDL